MVLLSLAKAVWCLSRAQNTLSRTKGVIGALAARVAFLGHPEWLSRLLRNLDNNIKIISRRERGKSYSLALLSWLLELLCRVAHFPFGHLIAGVLSTSSCYEFSIDKIYRELLQGLETEGILYFYRTLERLKFTLEEIDTIFRKTEGYLSIVSTAKKEPLRMESTESCLLVTSRLRNLLSAPIALLLVMSERNLILAE
jgi:hypothetical protein